MYNLVYINFYTISILNSKISKHSNKLYHLSTFNRFNKLYSLILIQNLTTNSAAIIFYTILNSLLLFYSSCNGFLYSYIIVSYKTISLCFLTKLISKLYYLFIKPKKIYYIYMFHYVYDFQLCLFLHVYIVCLFVSIWSV